jgi:DNA modification methylase
MKSKADIVQRRDTLPSVPLRSATYGMSHIEQAKCVHANQKPLRLIERIIQASSDPGDVIWEPFGGLCSVAVAALHTERQCYSAEILPEYYELACERLEGGVFQPSLKD